MQQLFPDACKQTQVPKTRLMASLPDTYNL